MTVKAIKIYPKKGSKGESLTQAVLSPGKGIPGDRHNDISLQTEKALMFSEENPGGLCFGKFKANIIVSEDINNISRLYFNDAVLEIIGHKKFCFTDCVHFSEKKDCPMYNGAAMAKVIKGGEIRACYSPLT